MGRGYGADRGAREEGQNTDRWVFAGAAGGQAAESADDGQSKKKESQRGKATPSKLFWRPGAASQPGRAGRGKP